MSLAVAEEVVDDQTDDWEQEDKNTPQQLLRNWAVGLENLDCIMRKLLSLGSKIATRRATTHGRCERMTCIKEVKQCERQLTEDDDVENKDNEADYSTSCTILPGVTMMSLNCDRGGHSQSGESQLEEDCEHAC